MADTTDFSELYNAVGVVENISSGYRITVTADDGFVFDNPLNYSVSMGYGMWNDNAFTTDKELSDDRKTIIFTASKTVRWVKGTAVRTVKELSTFVNLYHVTDDMLSQLSKVRFINLQSGQLYDYGSYIYKAYTVDFDLSELDTDTNAEIMFGSYNTKVKAPKLNNYLYTVDLGSITITPKYNSKLDYNNTVIYIYLPYVKRLVLDVNEVMGKTLYITLNCNLYDGVGNYIIKTDDKVITTLDVTFSNNIPLMQKNNDLGTLVNGISLYDLNDIFTPIVKVIREIPVELITNANNVEREMIKDLINQGIINR